MLPTFYETIILLLFGSSIYLAGFFTRKRTDKLRNTIEIIASILVILIVFSQYDFFKSIIYISIVSTGYFAMTVLLNKYDKYHDVVNELENTESTRIELHRNIKRLLSDLIISILVFLGAILFLIYGPEYSPLKLIIIYGLVFAIIGMIKRVVVFYTITVYYSEEKERIYILSYLNSRHFPLNDLESIVVESSVDVLKLHPYLTLFSSNVDFTTSLQKVLRLNFPGESIYLTIQDTETWQQFFEQKTPERTLIKEGIHVLPFYHISNIKRLLGKLYFAITVKGVSAYTGLLLILYYFETPAPIITIVIILFWLFNIYISDRVLKVAMDAKETTNVEVKKAAEKIFKKAGIPNIKIYETDSAIYNGMATGMNIGKAMITLTTATLSLPLPAIEGIIAHEATHVKKRDVLWGQFFRAAFFLVTIPPLFFVIGKLDNIEMYAMPIFGFIWFLIIIFPIYQSFFSQWMEIRADFYGASLIDGGTKQMGSSLEILALSQEEAMKKKISYQTSKQEQEKLMKISPLKRSPWFIRVLEFQFMPHPPLYWRIKTLKSNRYKWGKPIIKRWIFDRFYESMPLK